ncbi:MAG: hypothetical protein GXO72_00490 [Caldiserica bacterium]|nr:hypothetical protein [Caldisericota bacterium]
MKRAVAEALRDHWVDLKALVPYGKGDLLALLGRLGKLEVLGDRDGGVLVHLILPSAELPRLRGIPDLVLMEV